MSDPSVFKEDKAARYAPCIACGVY